MWDHTVERSSSLRLDLGEKGTQWRLAEAQEGEGWREGRKKGLRELIVQVGYLGGLKREEPGEKIGDIMTPTTASSNKDSPGGLCSLYAV